MTANIVKTVATHQHKLCHLSSVFQLHNQTEGKAGEFEGKSRPTEKNLKSRPSEKILDRPRKFSTVREKSRPSEKKLNCPRKFSTVRENSRSSEKILDRPRKFSTVREKSRLSEKILDRPRKFSTVRENSRPSEKNSTAFVQNGFPYSPTTKFKDRIIKCCSVRLRDTVPKCSIAKHRYRTRSTSCFYNVT